MSQIQFRVLGMTCVMCTKAVEKALLQFDGVESVDVNLNAGKVIMTGELQSVEAGAIAETIRSAGYQPEIESLELTLTHQDNRDNTKLLEKVKSLTGIIGAEIKDDKADLLEISYLSQSLDPEEIPTLFADKGIEIKLEDFSAEAKTISSERSFLSEIIAGAITGTFLFWMMHTDIQWPWEKSLISFLIATPVFLYISRDIFSGAFNSLRHRLLNMDVMYAMGMGIAYVVSVLSTFNILNQHFMLYETAVLLATFLLFGRHLESRASHRTSEAIEKLVALQPREADMIDRESAPLITFTKSENEGLSLATLEALRGKFPELANGIQVAEERKATATLRIGDLEFSIDNPDAIKEKADEISSAFWENCRSLSVPLRDLNKQDWIRVGPGQQIPVDGKVLWGESYVDESMITGEPMAVKRKRDNRVVGGTINQDGSLILAATAVGKQSILGQIIRMVETAQAQKPPVQKLADRVVAVFIPIILVIAFITATLWLTLGNATIDFAFNIFISILVIACPCALGLATPTALTVGLGRSAALGILVKGGDIFERMEKLDTIAFDKTGTITEGKPQVVAIRSFAEDEDNVLMLAASVEQYSKHPLARAVVSTAAEKTLDIWPVTGFRQVDGMGVEGELFGQKLKVGKLQWLQESAEKTFPEEAEGFSRQHEEQGHTVFGLLKDETLIGLIVIADPLKSSSKETMEQIKNSGLTVMMLTGDSERTAKAVGSTIGVDRIFAGLMPDEKVEIVKSQMAEGRQLVFVGDGTNDAPALAAADVGIAMSGGTDIAMEAGDVVLMRDETNMVLAALQIGKRVMKQVRMNLFWAFFYNLMLVPVAGGLLYPFFGILIKPELAGFAMAMSSVSVVTFSLLLKRYQPEALDTVVH